MINEQIEFLEEREARLALALERAEAGFATGDDWDIIRFECNMPRPQVTLITVSIGDQNEFYRQS